MAEAPAYHPVTFKSVHSFAGLVRQDLRRCMLNLAESLDEVAQMNSHLAEANFKAIEFLYGEDHTEDFL